MPVSIWFFRLRTVFVPWKTLILLTFSMFSYLVLTFCECLLSFYRCNRFLLSICLCIWYLLFGSSSLSTKGKRRFYICVLVQRKIAVWVAKKPDIIGLFAWDIFFVSTLWSECGDLNPGPLGPEPSALPTALHPVSPSIIRFFGPNVKMHFAVRVHIFAVRVHCFPVWVCIIWQKSEKNSTLPIGLAKKAHIRYNDI